MSRSYAVTAENIAAQGGVSATTAQSQIISAATVRPKLYDLMMGSPETPADQAASWAIQRCTVANTGGSAITPSPIEPVDPASLCTAMNAPSMTGHTLTAGLYLLRWAQNLRATFRWVAAPGKEIVAPATAANGLVLINPVLTGAFDVTFCLQFEE